VSALRIATLREEIAGVGRNAHGDWNVLTSNLAQEPIQEFSPRLSISKGRRNAENLQLGAAQCQRHCERIIHIVADNQYQ